MITKMKTVTLHVGDQHKRRDFSVDHVGFQGRRDEDTGPTGRLKVGPDGAQTGFVWVSAARLRQAAPIKVGHRVSALARTLQKATLLRARGAEAKTISIFDTAALTGAFTGHDTVVNLATAIPSTIRFLTRSAWRENDHRSHRGVRRHRRFDRNGRGPSVASVAPPGRSVSHAPPPRRCGPGRSQVSQPGLPSCR
jgi:hypothetical protein